MALTFPRWLAAAAAGCLIILAALITPRAPRARPVDPRDLLSGAERRAAVAAGEAAHRLRSLMLRDSVRAAVSRLPRSDSSRIVVSGGMPADMRGVVRALDTRASLVRVRPAASPIDIVFVLDTASTMRGQRIGREFLGWTHVLPKGGERCLVIARHQPRSVTYSERSREYWNSYYTGSRTAARMLGPCAFYEAFGAPGAGIDRWLSEGGWKFGLVGSLKSRQPPLYLDPNWWEPLWGSASGWPMRLYLTANGYRCVSGEAEACRKALMEPNSDPGASRRNVLVRDDRVLSFVNADDYWWAFTFGPLEQTLLAEMAVMLGPETFRKFWTSDKAAPEAFFAATGQDIGAWTAAWARGVYGAAGRGPGNEGSSIGWAGFLALLGLGGAIASSRRRQVA